MYKCALSAAEFNARLVRSRPVSFLDLHTNIEQIASGTQPARVVVEMNPKDQSKDALKLETKVDCFSGSADIINNIRSDWVPVAHSLQPVAFPLALTKNQYQDTVSLFPFRFEENEGVILLPDAKEASSDVRELHDVPPTLMGAVPYKPAVITVTVRKRGRPKKVFDLFLTSRKPKKTIVSVFTVTTMIHQTPATTFLLLFFSVVLVVRGCFFISSR
jgi:hypothetical protein